MAREPLRGTEQQEHFWSSVLDEDGGNILLSARAGTGKSVSCREGMHRLIERGSNPLIRYACFNKSIADEFREKCPDGVEVGTMHSFGYRACAKALGSKLEKQKTYLLLDQLGGERLARKRRRSINKLVSIAKNRAEFPTEEATEERDRQYERFERLLTHYQIDDTGSPESVCIWAGDILAKSATATDVIDFDDMLWLPVIHSLWFPRMDHVFIDECQDLNPIQHELLPLMQGGGRAVCVGDPYQAIYAFRGADSRSIDTLVDVLGASVMPLTRTFRCPKSHVDLCNELVPDFEAGPDNSIGTIEEESFSDLLSISRPGDMVLCRTNAPLVGACLRAIGQHKPAFMRGRGIGEGLIDLIATLEPDNTTDLIRKLRIWEARQIAALEEKEADESDIEQVTDRVGCLESLAADSETVAECSKTIRSLFDDREHSDRITFSSVHRAKGSEARRVHFVDIPHGKPGEPLEGQRRNLRYVALSRSLDHLTIVDPGA